MEKTDFLNFIDTFSEEQFFDVNGNTLLLLAVKENNADLFQMLLNCKSNISKLKVFNKLGQSVENLIYFNSGDQ